VIHVQGALTFGVGGLARRPGVAVIVALWGKHLKVLERDGQEFHFTVEACIIHHAKCTFPFHRLNSNLPIV
jgi:hypothetical protein